MLGLLNKCIVVFICNKTFLFTKYISWALLSCLKELNQSFCFDQNLLLLSVFLLKYRMWILLPPLALYFPLLRQEVQKTRHLADVHNLQIWTWRIGSRQKQQQQHKNNKTAAQQFASCLVGSVWWKRLQRQFVWGTLVPPVCASVALKCQGLWSLISRCICVGH